MLFVGWGIVGCYHNNQQRLWKEYSEEESIASYSMDFTEVNTAFAKHAIALGPREQGLVLVLVGFPFYWWKTH